jgi:hypothetical protein
MNEFIEKQVSRRLMLAGMGSAALLSAELARAQQSASPPSDSHSQNSASRKPTNPGPDNQPLIDENSDSYTPP